MPNSIDNKIVEMQFDNANFEKNVKQSIKTLEQLNKALELDDAAKGFEQMEKAAESVDLSKLTSAAEMIEKRFSAAGIAGAAFIERMTNGAINAVVGLGHKVVGLAKSGGIARALKLEHANFMLNGLLKDTAKVAEIIDGPVSNAVSGTAYGLDAAANAAAQFVASGVKDMGQLERALTAVSGVAAMTGAQYEEIADIFTSAAGKGRVMTLEFNRINQRGVAAFAVLAEHLHKTEAEVRELAKQGKISFEMFSDAMYDAFAEQAKKANDTFEGALSNVKAALSRIGAKVATPALEALRKTFVALIEVINNVNKYLSNGIIKKIVTFIKHLGYIVPLTLKSKRFMDLLSKGIDTLDKAFTNISMVLQIVRKAFKNVFPDDVITRLSKIQKIFDKLTDLFDISGEKAAYLQMTLEGVFYALDIVLTLVGQVLSILLPGFNNIYDAADSALTKILKFTAYISVLLEHLDKWLKNNNILKAAVDALTGSIGKLSDKTSIFRGILTGIATVIGGVVYVFGMIASGFIEFISQASRLPIVQTIINDIKNAIILLGNMAAPILETVAGGFIELVDSAEKFAQGQYLTTGLEKLNDVLNSLYWGFQNVIGGVKSFFGIFNKNESAIDKIDSVSVSFEKLAASANDLGVGGGVIVRNVDAVSNGLNTMGNSMEKVATTTEDTMWRMNEAGKLFVIGFGASIISAGVNIGRAFGNMAGLLRNLKSVSKSIKIFFEQLQLNLRIKTLMSFAACIVVLAGSLALLTMLDTKKLIAASVAVSILLVAMASVTRILTVLSGTSLESFHLAAKGMLEFASALFVIAAAVKILSTFGHDWKSLALAVTGMVAVMIAMSTAVIIVGNKQKAAIQGTTSMLAFASAIYILMASLQKIQTLDLNKIQASIPIMLEIMAGLVLVSAATGLVISPMGGIAFVGVVAGILLLFEGMKLLTEVDNKVLYQIEDLIDHIVEAINHILIIVVVYQALATLEALFMWMAAKVNGITKGLRTMFNIAQKGIKYLGVAALIISIAASIKIIGDTIIALSAMPLDKLFLGVGVTAAVASAVVGIVEFVNRMFTIVIAEGGTAKQIAAALVGIAAAILSITLSIKLLADMDAALFTNGLIKIIAISVIILGIIKLLSLIQSVDNAYQPAIRTMAGIAALIGIMVASIAVLSFIPLAEMVTAMASLVAVVATLGLVMQAVAQMSAFTVAGTIAVGEMAVIFGTLGYVMYLLKDVTTSNVLANILVLEISVLAMANILRLLAGMSAEAVAGMQALVAITGVLTVLTVCSLLLEKVNPVKLLANLTILSVAMLVLGTIAVALGLIAQTGVGGAALVIGIAALSAFAIVMLKVSAAAAIFGVAANLIATGLDGISKALHTMSDLDMVTISTGLLSMGLALGVISLTALPLSMFTLVLIGAVPVFAMFGAAVNTFASGLTMLENLDLSNLLTQMLYLGNAVQFVVDRFWEFAAFSVIANVMGGACTVLGTGLMFVAAGLLAMAAAFDTAIVGVTMFVAALTMIGDLIVKITDHINDMVKSIQNMGASTVDQIYNALIQYASTQLWTAGQTMMVYVEEGFIDQIPDSVKNIIQDVADGLEGEAGRKEADIYTTGYELANWFKAGMQDALGAYCEAQASVDIVKDVGDGYVGESERQQDPVGSAGAGVGDAYGSGLWSGLAGWLSGIGEKLKEFWASLKSGDIFTNGFGVGNLTSEVEKKMSAYTSSWNKHKVYGKSLEFDAGLNSGTIKYVGAGVGYLNTETGELTNTIQEAVAAANKEAEALNENAGATGGNSKAKKANKEANEKKTKSIDEESEALDEETEATEDNREEILALAEAIEVVTKEFDKSFNYLQSRDNFKIVKNLTKAFSTFWSKGLGEDGWKKASQVNKTFKQVNKIIKGTTQVVKKGVYSFDETGKYAGKLAKKVSKSAKQIETQVMQTGKTAIKVAQGQATVFNKVGNSVQKTTMRVAKNVKNLGNYFNELRQFQSEMEGIDVYAFIHDTGNAYDYITKLRQIEKYFTSFSKMPQKIQNFMLGINEKLSPLNDSLNALGRRIDGVGSYISKSSQSTAYVQDAFISLAATLYDGSEAANEYETEHARLLFLLEHGEATIEEVEEHFQSYISRIMKALEEYRNSIEENLRGSFDIWSEFDKKLDDSNKNFLDTIESQIAGYSQWSNMLFELSKRGVDMNILKMLTDEGVSSYGKLKSLLGMTANQIALFNQRYAESETAITQARDTALAALANATTRASQRAAAENGKIAKTQLKQSKKVAKQLLDDAKAVAETQARYRAFNAREEKQYMDSLTEMERQAYKERLKEVKKAMKAEQKMAKKEETKRAREKKVEGILAEVKSFEQLRKTYHKYMSDTKMLSTINKQVAKSLDKIKDKIKSFDGRSVKQMNYSWLAFAETLESTGNEANDYLTEMAERLEKFIEEVENATKAGNDMFKTFEKADSQTFSQMYAGIKSQILARSDMAGLFNKVIKMGFSQDAINYLNDIKSDLPQFYATLESWAKMTTNQVALTNESIALLYSTTNNLNEILENGFANTTAAAAKIAVEDAQRNLNNKKSKMDQVIKDSKSIITEASKNKAALQKELTNIEKQINSYQVRLGSKSLSKKERQTIQNAITTLNNERATTLSQLNEADKKIAQANEAIEKANLEYEKAQATLKERQQRLNEESSIASKQYILTSAKEKLKTAENELNAVKSSVAANNKTIINDITQWQNELNNWQARLANATKNKDKKAQNEAKAQIANITQQIASAQAKLNENTNSLTKAQAAYDKALKDVNEAQAEYNKVSADQKTRAAIEQRIQDILVEVKSYEALSKTLRNYRSDADLVKRINQGIKDSVSGISGAIDQFGKHWKNITNLSLKDTNSAFSEIANGFLRFADTLADVNEEFETFDDYIAARTQALSDYRDTLYDTIKGQVNLFEEFKRYSGEKATSAGTYLDNMESQLSGLEDWLTNLETLAKRGVSGDIIAMFASEGQNSFEKVAAFASATEDEIVELVGQFARYQELLDEAADRAMATVGYSYTDAALEATQKLLDAFKGIDTSRIQEEAYETGVMIINGVKDGIGHVMPELMADIADSAEEAAAKKAGAAIGKAINDGIVKAVSDNVASTVNAAIEKFKMAVDTVNSYVQQNLQSEYTITIHVDASEIDAAIARMNAAIGGINANAGATQQAVVTSQANQQSPTVEPLGTEGTVNNVTLNYTQNNTSPVALSRTEIYRQTQNQLSTINGAINAAMG